MLLPPFFIEGSVFSHWVKVEHHVKFLKGYNDLVLFISDSGLAGKMLSFMSKALSLHVGCVLI